MATFYLFNNANFDGSYKISARDFKDFESKRSVAGTISKVKIVFTNTGKAKVSARLSIDGKSQGLASEETYNAGTNIITIIAENGTFIKDSLTTVRVRNDSSAASIVVKGIEVTYTASSSGGGGGSGGGSGGDTTPSISGSASFPPTGIFTQSTTLRVDFNISFSNCEFIEASLYDTIGQKTIATSGRITGNSYAGALYFTLNKGDNYNLRAQVFYVPPISGSWGEGYTYYPNGGSTYTYKYIGDLGPISAPSVNSPYYGKRNGTSFIYPGETYTLSWSAPETNGNTINGYQCLFNGNLFNSSNSTSISIGNNLNEKENGEWKIKAVAGTNPGTSSSISSGTYVYNLKIDTQDSIAINNSTLASGSAGFSWEQALINVNDSI